MAEVAVHLNLATLPSDFMMLEIYIPDEIEIEELSLKSLSNEWNMHPHYLETQKLGDEFINLLETCILKVPSAVVKGDFNYLINPHHPDFKKIDIASVYNFPFDKRLFK